MKVNISGKELLFLDDTGRQFSNIMRDDYDSGGVGIDGSKFAFDGIVYLNLVLSNEEGETFERSYEAVLVSSQVSSNIFGFNSEEKFTPCCRNSEDNIMTFITKSRKPLKVNVIGKTLRRLPLTLESLSLLSLVPTLEHF